MVYTNLKSSDEVKHMGVRQARNSQQAKLSDLIKERLHKACPFVCMNHRGLVCSSSRKVLGLTPTAVFALATPKSPIDRGGRWQLQLYLYCNLFFLLFRLCHSDVLFSATRKPAIEAAHTLLELHVDHPLLTQPSMLHQVRYLQPTARLDFSNAYIARKTSDVKEQNVYIGHHCLSLPHVHVNAIFSETKPSTQEIQWKGQYGGACILVQEQV
jgi:hypothetical protein